MYACDWPISVHALLCMSNYFVTGQRILHLNMEIKKNFNTSFNASL